MSQIVGAYPLYNPLPDPEPLVATLAASPLVAGLEVPFLDGRVVVPPGVRPGWEYVVTLIPLTMGRLASDPDYGLASRYPAGRRAALTDVREALDAVRAQGLSVRALEVQSAPTRTADPGAFADALAQLVGWAPDGLRVVVEHQDAWTDSQPVQKGFLPLADELDAAEAAGAGVVINWARSVIEARDASAGLAHVRSARERGLLDGVIFSSVCDRDNDLGPAWADLHALPAGLTGAPAGSLLDAAGIAACRSAAGQVWVGYKVNLPAASSVAQRSAALLETAALVAGP